MWVLRLKLKVNLIVEGGATQPKTYSVEIPAHSPVELKLLTDNLPQVARSVAQHLGVEQSSRSIDSSSQFCVSGHVQDEQEDDDDDQGEEEHDEPEVVSSHLIPKTCSSVGRFHDLLSTAVKLQHVLRIMESQADPRTEVFRVKLQEILRRRLFRQVSIRVG